MGTFRRYTIKGLILDPTNNSPVVILQDVEETTIIPIWIGVFEANAIAVQLESIETPRPMTHDLIRSLLEALNAELEKVVITELREGTFYAELHVKMKGKNVVIDARPSDALAIAVRTRATILVADDVVQQSRSLITTDREEWTPEALKRWLEDISPEDLGKYTM